MGEDANLKDITAGYWSVVSRKYLERTRRPKLAKRRVPCKKSGEILLQNFRILRDTTLALLAQDAERL